MPKTVPGSKQKHPAFNNLTLFASPDSKGARNIWQCRVIFDRDRVPVRSLHLEYLPNDDKNLAEAQKIAVEKYYELEKEYRLGLPLRKLTVARAAELYLEEAETGLAKNKELSAMDKANTIPRYMVPGGNSAWDGEKLRQARFVINNLVKPFYIWQHGNITHATDADCDAWNDWRSTTQQAKLAADPKVATDGNWTAGTINKQNRVLRSLFKWAKTKGYCDRVPEIKDARESLRKSRRPEMTQKQYTALLKYVEDGYLSENIPAKLRVYRRLFYLWLCTIDATGVRPWKDAKNAIRMDDIDIKLTDDGDVEHIIVKRYEKVKEPYAAVADKQWLNIYQDILAIREAWGITSEYLFAHPISDKNNIKKNAPILNFRTQWRNAVEYLGFAEKGAPQQERISPYSIRHRYAARRLLVNKDISLEELAQVMGSSPRVLFEVYWHYNTEDNYKDLVSGGYQLKPDRVRLMDDYGIRIKNVNRDSPEHWDWYKKHPRFTEPPTRLKNQTPPWKE